VALTIYVALGYIAVPVLFQYLPKFQAGAIAGVYLAIAHWQMLAILVIAWGLSLRTLPFNAFSVKLIHLPFVALLLIEAVQLFKLSPEMKALKLQALTQTGQALVDTSPQWPLFAQLHGISQVLYLLTCGLILWLLYSLNRSYKNGTNIEGKG